ncbi:MAG TPA: flagellar basal-body MS-ring/collar protein FliF [Terriglobales bacterium]|nr:flagellar basal-body MS-ring/collar protein FliF [Terriglobales bacterium]
MAGEGPKTFSQALHQVGELWRGLSLRQRLLLGGGAALVGITLWVFVGLLGKPKYATLYSGLKPAEAQALAGRLAAKNIAYELSPDGSSLRVPVEQLDASRLETAAQGLPRNARLGFELFDTPNWAGSDFTEKVNYQRALEGELERTLQTLSEVEGVRVHLVMPRESLYSEQEQPAKAAVILKTRGGRLSDQAQLAIPQLVASAVENLRPENVTVIDADSNTPLLRSRGGGAAASAAYDLDDELSKTLVRTLEPVVGASHVRASVHVEYDLSSSDNTEEIYDPKATTALTQQRTEENMGGAGPGGIPGTASNLPAGTAPAAAAAVNAAAAQETQSSHSESTTFAVSKSVRHTVSPAGRIKRIAAAVLLDDVVESSEKDGKKISTRRKHTEEELKQISQLAAAAIGLDTQRGDLLSLENLSFQELPVEVPAAPGRLDTARRVLVGWAGMLRYLGIAALFAIVYLLMLRPIKKELLGTLRALPGQIARPAREQDKAGASAPTLLSEVEVQMPAGVEDARRASTLKRQLAEKVKAEPAAASRLVQSWIRGEGAE